MMLTTSPVCLLLMAYRASTFSHGEAVLCFKLRAIFSFSLVPLYIGLSTGVFFMVLAAAQIISVVYLWVTNQKDQIVPGWTSVLTLMLIGNGIIMILLGFIGVYLGYVFQEVKRRPVYLLKKGKHESE